MIRIKNLFLRYIRQYYALYDISFDIEEGERVAFVGEKNSGKTSLIRILAKLEKDYTGEVYIKNIPLKKINYIDDVNLGYLPSCPIFFEKKTVYQNLVYVLKLQKFKPAMIENLINETLIEFNIERLKDVKVTDLTLYEKYLVSIARLSLRKLDIVIVDGILDNLEGEEKEKIIEYISKKFLDKESVFILATENEENAKMLCKRKIYFENGSIVKEKSKKWKNLFVEQFLVI